MKTYMYGFAMILLIILHSSCHILSLSNRNHKQVLLTFDSKWEKTIKSRTDSLKGKWIDFIIDDLSYFREKGLNFTKEDFQNLTYVPIVVYHIDSNSFQKYNGKLSKNDLKIDTCRAVYCAYKEEKLIIMIETEFLNGIVTPVSSGVVTESFSTAISKLDKNEMKTVCEINITCSQNSSYRRKRIAFIDKNGQLMYIDPIGMVLSFEKKMQSLKDYMNSYE